MWWVRIITLALVSAFGLAMVLPTANPKADVAQNPQEAANEPQTRAVPVPDSAPEADEEAGPVAIAGLATGSLIVEQIFGIPGIGRYFVQGALNRDYTLVLGVVIFYAALIIFLNLVADLLYRVLDPRVRYE